MSKDWWRRWLDEGTVPALALALAQPLRGLRRLGPAKAWFARPVRRQPCANTGVPPGGTWRSWLELVALGALWGSGVAWL
jgi:hypothetical protein